MLYPFELRALASVFISLPASAAPEAVQTGIYVAGLLYQVFVIGWLVPLG